jgi:hypothetical protein
MEDRFESLVTLKNPRSNTIPAEKFERILRPPKGEGGRGRVENRTLRTSDIQHTAEILQNSKAISMAEISLDLNISAQ